MTDKEFDDILKHKLDQFRAEYDPQTWDSLEQRIENENLAEGDGFDEAIRASMAGFAGSGLSPDWETMEQRLDAEEAQVFDEHVKESVGKYSAPYDPSSWPILSDKITEDERLRKKLIALKVLELAAVLVALLTLFNFLPLLEKAIMDEQEQVVTLDDERASMRMEAVIDKKLAGSGSEASNGAIGIQSGAGTDGSAVDNSGSNGKQSQFNESVSDATSSDQTRGQKTLVKVPTLGTRPSEVVHERVQRHAEQCEVQPDLGNDAVISLTVATVALPNELTSLESRNTPSTQLRSRKKSLRLGLFTSLDFNHLYMPSEQFYADGRKIKFSEKYLLATGYSVGATLLFDRGAWSFETGLVYSQKSFEPNRVLQIGKTFDVRTVDFDEISMHLVKVPLNARWNFDRKGKTRFYLVGGAGLNVIAAANYDLLTRGGVGSRPPGGTRTDVEVARVRENFLDGAEFSSKSFITLSGGIGVEQELSKKFSVFVQPTYDYQLPILLLSDREGKQLQFLSLQFGTRVRLQ